MSAEYREQHMKLLQSLGMVHVTGLPLNYGDNDARNGILISTSRLDWGKWGEKNGMIVAIIGTGEIFLSVYSENTRNLVRCICPCGSDANVPCSSGEKIHSYHLFCRVADPMWRNKGEGYEFHTDPDFARAMATRWEETYVAKLAKQTNQQARVDRSCQP